MRKKKHYSFTKHAYIRLTERSSETKPSIIQYLNEEKFELIGVENKTNRKHVLIFSQLDNCWHAIVFDEKNLQIITILYPEYYQNLAWIISEDTLESARKLSCPEESQEIEEVVDAKNVSTNMKISGRCNNGNISIVFNIGRWEVDKKINIWDFEPDNNFWNHVRSEINKKKAHFLQHTEQVLIRNGNKGNPRILAFPKSFK